MAGKKSEKIKNYIVIGLAVVAMVVGYFRFVHKRTTPIKDSKPSSAPVVQLDVPQIEIKVPQKTQTSGLSVMEPLRAVVRDIFVPVKWPTESESETERQKTSKPVQSLKLRGTIVSGGKAMAIINDQFVRKGDWIGEYEVVKIMKKTVLLDSGVQKIELEMVKNE